MAKYTVCCFKDYDELLKFEKEQFGQNSPETGHLWSFDRGRIHCVNLTLLNNFRSFPWMEGLNGVDEILFMNCSMDDCTDEKFLQWYKEMEERRAEEAKRLKELEEKMRKEHEDDPPVYAYPASIYPFVVSDTQNS